MKTDRWAKQKSIVKRRNIGKLFDVNTGFNIARSSWNMVDAAQQHHRSRSMQGCFNKISTNNSNSEASLVNISYTCRRNVSSVGGWHRKLSISDSWGTSSSLLNWIIIVPDSLVIISKFQNFDIHPSQSSIYNTLTKIYVLFHILLFFSFFVLALSFSI